MAVELYITDRKVFNQYANAPDLGSNLSNYTTYLKGGVMNVQKVVYTVELGWRDVWVGVNTGNIWQVEDNILIRNQGSFIAEGFSIGDKIDLVFSLALTTIFSDRIITNITDDRIYFDGASIALTVEDEFANLNGGKTDIHGLEYSFGIIPNEDEPFFNSLLDNSNQTYYADNIGIGGSTAFVAMQAKTQSVKGWDTSRVGNTKVKFLSRPSTYIQQFEIHHEYIIAPYNLPDLLSGNKSYKYVSKFDFRANVNNVNTAKVHIDDIQLGSVGDFDENYNGYSNDFTLTNLVYTDVASSSPATALNLSSKTRVEFSVESASGLFNIGDPTCVFHSFEPGLNDYSKSPLLWRDGWVFRSNRVLIDDPASDFDGILQLDVDYVDANNINVSFEIEFNATERAIVGESGTYLLGCEVGDGDLLNQTLNVTLLTDADTYIDDKNITDLIVSDGFGFNPYYRFIAPTLDLFSTYYGWIEDEIVSWHRFGVNRTISKDAEILKGRFQIVAYEDATGETFELQNEELDLSGQLTVPASNPTNPSAFDFQLINDNRTRGYNLPAGDEFNLLLFETDDEDATYKYYEWRVGFKMNWQSWISLPLADSVFIDTSDTFNGLNNRASNYSLKEGWSIRANWQFDMQGIDDDGNVGETEYNFTTDQFSIFDFDEQDNDPTMWNCEILTSDEFGNDLGGAILNGEETFIKAIFTPTAPFVITDIIPYWGEIRIAEDNQPGFNNDVLSTSKPYLPNNRIIPLDGDSFADINLVANTIEVDCRTKISEIKENINYKLSGRLANVDEPIPPVEWVFQTDFNSPADGTFFPSVVTIGGELPTWALKGSDGIDGTQYIGVTSINQSSRTITEPLLGDELEGSVQDVVVTFSTNDATNITQIQFDIFGQEIVGSFDLSLFTNCIYYQISRNQFTTLSLPILTANLIEFFCTVNTLTILDFTNFGAFFGGNVQFQLSPSLTTVTFPATSRTFSRLSGSTCSITSVDISMLTGALLDVQFQDNNITTFTPPNSSASIPVMNVSSNSITSIDLSNTTGVAGRCDFEINQLATVIFPTTIDFGTGNNTTNGLALRKNFITSISFASISTDNSGCYMNLENNSMSQGLVDTLLAEFVALGWTGCTLQMAGVPSGGYSTNSAPSASGATDKATLVSRGWTVVTN